MRSSATGLQTLFLMLILLIAGYSHFTAIDQTVVSKPIRADAREYVGYAYNLRHNGVYSRQLKDDQPLVADSLRSPGYALFLAVFMDTMPTWGMLRQITLAQMFISLGIVVLTFAILQRFLAPGYALAGTALTAISPHLVSIDTYLLSETLFTFFTVLAFWCLAVASRKPTFWYFLLAGLVLAAASLVRPTLQYFIIPAAVLVAFYLARPIRWRAIAGLFAGFILLMTPWLAFKATIPESTSSTTLTINTLHHGLYPNFMYQDRPDTFGLAYRVDPKSEQIGQSLSTVLSEIHSRFVTEPLRHLQWFLLGKPAALWGWSIVNGTRIGTGAGQIFIYPVERSPYFSDPVLRAGYLTSWVLHWPMVIFSGLACLLVWLPRERLGLSHDALFVARMLALLMGYFVAIHVVGAPFPRYSIPLRPFTFGLGMFSVAFLWQQLRAARFRTVSTLGST